MQAKENCKIKYSKAWAMEMLGVDPNADEETIKKAWRMKSREAHPDTLMRLFHSLDQFHNVHLAYDINANNQVAIAAAGGIESLVQLATDGTPEAKEHAACALWHLAADQFHNVQLAYDILRLKKYWLAETERKKQWLVIEPEDEDDPKNHDTYVRVAATFLDGKRKWLRGRLNAPPIPENPEISNANLTPEELSFEVTSYLNGDRTSLAKFLNTFSEDGKKAFTIRYGVWHATKRIEQASHMVFECRPKELNLIAYAKSSTFTCDEENGNLLSFECTPVEELTTKYLDRNPTSGLFESEEGNRVVLLPLCYAEQQHWNGYDFGYALRLLMTEMSLHKQYACAEESPAHRRMQEAFRRITQECLVQDNPDVLGKEKIQVMRKKRRICLDE